MTVNHWVTGSSPVGGAIYEEASVIAGFFVPGVYRVEVKSTVQKPFEKLVTV